MPTPRQQPETNGSRAITKETTISIGAVLVVLGGVTWNVRSSDEVHHAVELLQIRSENSFDTLKADLRIMGKDVEAIRAFQAERITKEEFRNFMEKFSALNPTISMPK